MQTYQDMLTYQDFLAVGKGEGERAEFIGRLIEKHEGSDIVRTARDADEYDAQRNVTIRAAVPVMYTISGIKVRDKTKGEHHIASNFFHKLNAQRCNFLLSNGMTFEDKSIKERLGGSQADTRIRTAAYKALIHGLSFVFLNVDRLHVFPVTEFAPMWDEETGALRAGVRYWRIDEKKPMIAVLYEEDGCTTYRTEGGSRALRLAKNKTAYKLTTAKAKADPLPVIIGQENYSSLPIVPMWGSELHQSTLVGMREAIDAYDLIQSGFVSDLETCAQAFMLLENYGGMSDEDLMEFRDRLKMHRIGVVDTQSGGKVNMQTQEIPHEASGACLDRLRKDIYENYGGLDTSSISAGNKTATEIKAAYQSLNDAADELEYQVIECVEQILRLIGIEGTPVFKRSQIANEAEQVEMVMAEAAYLDDQTVLELLPNITPEMVENILERRDANVLTGLSGMEKVDDALEEEAED